MKRDDWACVAVALFALGYLAVHVAFWAAG